MPFELLLGNIGAPNRVASEQTPRVFTKNSESCNFSGSHFHALGADIDHGAAEVYTEAIMNLLIG